MEKIEYAINLVSVIVTLINEKTLCGTVNIAHYRRFSDFIDNHESTCVRLFDVKHQDDITGAVRDFLLVPKNKILFYQPKENK